MEKIIGSERLNYNVIGEQTKLEGDVILKGDTIIAGEIKGSLTITDDSKLILERTSAGVGKIFSHDIEIFGSFSGTIEADGRLTVRSGGSVSGKINAKSISIYPGAILNIEGETKED